MGLLDELLGGLAGQATGGRAPVPPTRATGTGSTSAVLTALLPVVLGMLANRGSQPASTGRASAGGLGDILGQVLGGATGGGSSAGGLEAVLAQLQRAGFGPLRRAILDDREQTDFIRAVAERTAPSCDGAGGEICPGLFTGGITWNTAPGIACDEE